MASIQGKRSREKCQRVWLLLKSPPSTLDQNESKVEELLSRKAFEKLATHQDLSNAIEKVFFRSEFLKKKLCSFYIFYLLACWKRSCWLVLVFIPYHPQAFASLLRYLHIGTYNIYVKNIGLSKKDVRDVVVVQSSKIALWNCKLMYEVTLNQRFL